MLLKTILLTMLLIESEEAVWKKTSQLPPNVIQVQNWTASQLSSCINKSTAANLCETGNYWGTLFFPNEASCAAICSGIIDDAIAKVDLPDLNALTVIYQYHNDVSECSSESTEHQDSGHIQQITQGSTFWSTTERGIFDASECIKLDLDGKDICLMMVDARKISQYYTFASTNPRRTDFASSVGCVENALTHWSPETNMYWLHHVELYLCNKPNNCSKASSPSDCAEKCLDAHRELKPVLLTDSQALFLFWNENTNECSAGYLQKQTGEIAEDDPSDVHIYLIHPRSDSCIDSQPPNISSVSGFTARTKGTVQKFPSAGLSYKYPPDIVFATVWKANQVAFALKECDHMCPQNFVLATIYNANEEGAILRKILNGASSNKVLAIGLYLDIIYNATYWADNADIDYKDVKASPEPYDGHGRIQSRFKVQSQNGILVWKSARSDSDIDQCLCRILPGNK